MNRWALALVCVLSGACLWSAPVGRNMEREAKIEQALGQLDPSQVPVFQQGRIAMDEGNLAEAERYFTQVCKQVPAFDPAWRRLGSTLLLAGKREEGIAYCRKAVALNRSMENLSTLAYDLAFQGKKESSPQEKAEALALLLECRRTARGGEADILQTTAQLSLELDQLAPFKEATAALRRDYPDAMQTHYFSAVAEAIDDHWIRAEREIRQAQRMGLPQEVAQRFLDSGVSSRATGWRVALYSLVAAGLWAAGMGLLFGVGFALSKVTMRQAGKADPTEGISGGEQRLRRIYRLVLNITGVYYYISLPVVLVMVVVTTGAVTYGFLVIGWIPIKLLIILGIGAVMTIWAMGKSLFLRVPQEDPGRSLAREEAEGLWRLTGEVAQALGTRPIDEIRITPGTDLAVYEKGTWREKLQNQARRVLILGTAVLHGFRQDDFRGVLAHEYGHFSHRDTAGGDVALRVQNDMVKFYDAMCHAGQATLLNVAFHFLRFYNFVFRRISHGATRLQEILADRVAAQTYGALALEGGLRHVIRRSIEFDTSANEEIQEAIESRRPLQNLYEVRPKEAASVQEAFDKALTRTTTEDDTHPSPMDRFRLAARYGNPSSERTSDEVWQLFRDPEAIIREMMSGFEARVAPYRSAEDPSPKPADLP